MAEVCTSVSMPHVGTASWTVFVFHCEALRLVSPAIEFCVELEENGNILFFSNST